MYAKPGLKFFLSICFAAPKRDVCKKPLISTCQRKQNFLDASWGPAKDFLHGPPWYAVARIRRVKHKLTAVPAIMYGCETGSLAIKKDTLLEGCSAVRRYRKFVHMWEKLHSEELYKVCPESNETDSRKFV